MIDINWKGMLCAFGIALLFTVMIALMVASAGCVTAAKEVYKEARATPTPTPTPEPTPIPPPTPTPKQTPTPLPTVGVKPVNPYLHGERSENQWFKWIRQDVSGYKDMEVGIIVYRHAFLDKYTWYNNAMGNYQVEYPLEGQRFFVVWVHEEMFQTNTSGDTRMWGIDQNAFRLQVNNQMLENDQYHLPVNRILELDEQWDFYHINTAPPFGYRITYSGNNPETGGMVAESIGYLRMGQGNSIDGYLIFQVPEKTFSEDLLLLGSFSTFGTAYWKFTE
jgi:hypothetical protein